MKKCSSEIKKISIEINSDINEQMRNTQSPNSLFEICNENVKQSTSNSRNSPLKGFDKIEELALNTINEIKLDSH